MRSLSVAVAMLLAPLPAFALSRQEVCENLQNNFAPVLAEKACTEMLGMHGLSKKILLCFIMIAVLQELQ
jgi:hypothetical protein